MEREEEKTRIEQTLQRDIAVNYTIAENEVESVPFSSFLIEKQQNFSMLVGIIIQRREIDSVSKRDYFRVRVEQARVKSVLGMTGTICLREDHLLVHPL